jgi:CHAT domain-containing protein
VSRRVLSDAEQFGTDAVQNKAREIYEVETALYEDISIASKRPEKIGLNKIKAILNENEYLIEYVLYKNIKYPEFDTLENRIGVYLVTGGANGTITSFDIGSVEDVEKKVENFSSWRNNMNLNEEHFIKEAIELRKMIFDPLKIDITKNDKSGENTSRLYIATDSHISLIPFETLPVGSFGDKIKYLIEEIEIVYIPSGFDLTYFSDNKQTSNSKEIWLIGDPDYNASPSERLQSIKNGLISSSLSVENINDHNSSETENNIGGDTWNRLPETRNLVSTIAYQAEKSGYIPRILVDHNATEELVYEIKAPRVLLFATHGDFVEKKNAVIDFKFNVSGLAPKFAPGLVELSDPRMRTMLVLAGANNIKHHLVGYKWDNQILTTDKVEELGLTEKELSASQFEIGDGYLTAYEVWMMNLTNTELVALIGCESGLGVVEGGAGRSPAKGEAVSGLRQAFNVAGARSMLISLWSVPEAQTVNQMNVFTSLWFGDKMNRYQAFRKSQLNALTGIRSTGGSLHPFWWSGFIYIGDPGDL